MSEIHMQYLNNIIKDSKNYKDILDSIENNNENSESETFSDDFSKYEADNNTDWVKWSISVLNSFKKIV